MQTQAEEFKAETMSGRMRCDRGAVGTEMAIVVAIVVAIALALGAVMVNSARNHQACIPETPGAVGDGCENVVGGG